MYTVQTKTVSRIRMLSRSVTGSPSEIRPIEASRRPVFSEIGVGNVSKLLMNCQRNLARESAAPRVFSSYSMGKGFWQGAVQPIESAGGAVQKRPRGKKIRTKKRAVCRVCEAQRAFD